MLSPSDGSPTSPPPAPIGRKADSPSDPSVFNGHSDKEKPQSSSIKSNHLRRRRPSPPISMASGGAVHYEKNKKGQRESRSKHRVGVVKKPREETPGPIKRRFMPFFRRFWPHLGPKLGDDKGSVVVNPIYGRAIEEVDPFVFEDTFCVLSKKFNKNYIFRFSASRSLFLFGPLNSFRRLCIFIVTNQLFDLFIIFTILGNCIALAFDNNKLYKNKETSEYQAADYDLPKSVELSFLAVYTVEMMLKIVAKGFVINKFSYLRNGWNILDFIVVICGFVTELLDLIKPTSSPDLDVLRTFRVLRAVKTISILPGLRMMINALMNSMVQLIEVMALTFFCLCIFALFALEVYMGKLHQVCVLIRGSVTSRKKFPDLEPIEIDDPDRHDQWHKWVRNESNWQHRDFPKKEFVLCSNETGGRSCPPDYVCLPNLNENPDDGWTSFDTFLSSMLSTFQLITLDFWERLYELVMSTAGPWCMPFFIMVVFLGSFYLLNLMLAVVAMSYEAEAHSWHQKPLSKHQKLTLHRTDSTFSFDDPTRLNVTVLTQLKKRTATERENLARTLRNASIGKRKPRRAIRRKLLLKQNASGGGKTLSAGTAGTPDNRSATGSVSGSIYGTLDCPPIIRRNPSPSNKTLHSGVLGERTVSAKPKKPKKVVSVVSLDGESSGIVNVPKGSGGILRAASAITSAVSKVQQGGGVRVNALITKTYYNDDDEPAYLHMESERERERMSHTAPNREREPSSSMVKVDVTGRRLTSAPPDMQIPLTPSPLQPVVENLDEDVSPSPVSESPKAHNGIIAGSWDEVESDTKTENEGNMMDGKHRDPMPEVEDPSLPHTASGSLVFNMKDEEAGGDGTEDIDETHHCEYDDDDVGSAKFSEGGLSVMSTDLIDDVDRYSNSTTTNESTKYRLRPKKYNFIQRGLKYLKHNLSPYVNNWLFEAFITTSIILNTILLATEHHNQPKWLDDCLELGGYVFTSIFAFECAFKILVLQRDYFSQNWNIFDLIIVCASFLDVFIDTALPGSNTIRSFRLLRIFKLAQSWITMKVLLNIIFSTFGALGNLTLVLVIVIYIFAILGMQVVGNKYTPKKFGVSEPDDPEFPRWNFQDFWYAFMMVFRVLCGEWIEPLWDCLTAHKDQGEWKCFIIFLPILIVGNFIVLNLFLALLLNSFNTEELKAQREKEKETSGKTDNLKRVVGLLLNRSKKNIKPPEIPAITVAEAPNEICYNDPSPLDDIRLSPTNQRFKMIAFRVIQQNRKNVAERAILRAEAAAATEIAEVHFQKPSSRRGSFLSGKMSPTAETIPVKARNPGPCFPPACYNIKCFRCERFRNPGWERCRKFALRIVAHPFFEWGILVLILASSITLCFEDIYLEQNADLKMTLFILNNFFTFLFIIEMLLKWMALGVYEYFTTFWTLLDIFIVMVSVITLVFDIQNQSWTITSESQAQGNLQGLGALKALRTLRALRPLRAISRWQGMKVVVNALMYAIPSIFNVLLVCLLFWLVFAIMGVQFFKGKFYKCIFDNNGSAVHYKIVGTMGQCCERNDTSWINTTPNFDNVFEGYLSLFQVATFEGWIELMRATTDADPSELNKQSVRDQSFGNYAFFVIFIIFGSFFTLNLFIGVIIDNFNMLKKKYEGNLLEVLLTPSQRRYYTAMKKLGRKKPRRVIRRPTNRFFALFYDISMSRRFEIAIFVLIFLNMVLMSFEHHNQRLIFVHILAGCNSFFSTIYALEAMVKILGLRHYYFTVPWNVFDFCLVLFSVIDLFLVDADLKVPFPPTLLRVVRVFRIGRVLRLIKAAKGIRKLLFALIVSLPALFNIGALLALITFIYAILGMALFKDAVLNNAIDEVFSFQTFAKSSLMLFRLMTAAGWNEVLDALLVEEPICGKFRKMVCGRPGEPECVSRVQSVFYMVSYIIISFLIVINMYIAIILENFVEANRDEEVGIIEDDLEMFYVRWSRYDPTASQFIVFDQLSEFLASLDPPLDIPKPNLVAIVSFNLPIARGNKIHCLDILHALVKHVLGHVDDSEEFRKIQDQMEHKFRKQFPSRKLLDIVSSTRVWKVQHNAAMTIQKAWRDYKRRLNPPAEIAKSTQTMRTGGGAGSHGFGNMMSRMNNFFHHQDIGRRRRSSLQSSTAFLFTHRKTSDKHHVREPSISPNTTQPRNSYSSQSSSSVVASPLTRVDASSGERSRRRRLSPSRLSGGSFEVAVNYGTNSARLLSVHTTNATNNKSGTPSPVQALSHFSGGGPNPNNQPSVLTSSPTTPSSSQGNSRRGSVVVQVHQQQLCP